MEKILLILTALTMLQKKSITPLIHPTDNSRRVALPNGSMLLSPLMELFGPSDLINQSGTTRRNNGMPLKDKLPE